MISCCSVAGEYEYFWWTILLPSSRQPWRWRPYVPPKHWYSPIKLQPGVITQEATIQKVYVTYHFELPAVIAFQQAQNWASSIQFRTSQIFLSYILKLFFHLSCLITATHKEVCTTKILRSSCLHSSYISIYNLLDFSAEMPDKLYELWNSMFCNVLYLPIFIDLKSKYFPVHLVFKHFSYIHPRN
jgi:hypothetical protein